MKEIRIASSFIASITSIAGGFTARTTSASPTNLERSSIKATVRERTVGELTFVPGAGLHVQFRAQLDQPCCDGGHQRHAPFVRLRFLQDCNINKHSRVSYGFQGRLRATPNWGLLLFLLMPLSRRARSRPCGPTLRFLANGGPVAVQAGTMVFILLKVLPLEVAQIALELDGRVKIACALIGI